MSVPIIVGWIAVVALLNVTVPQLEVVGQMRSVSMSPEEAPSVIAMMRTGQVFEEIAALLGKWFWWPQVVRARPASSGTLLRR